MNIPFWPADRQFLRHRDEILEAIDRVLSKGELCLGDYGKDITEFEKWFAEFVGTKFAIMVGSGTQALYLAYRALGIGPGDEVITVGHTFSATFDQIVAVGATPVLVDIDPETGLIDPKKVEKAITSRTKAIVPVHLEGKVCFVEAIRNIAREHNLFVIEDAAQAIGATYQETFRTLKAGSMGNMGCFSLFPAKILGSVGNAGAITTNDNELAYKLRNLRSNYRFEKDPEKVDYGMNFEPDNIQAAVLNVRAKYLEQDLADRKDIAEKYLEAFKDLPIKLPLNQEGRVWQDFVIRVNVLDKPHLVKHLQDNGVGILGQEIIPYSRYPKLKLPELPHTNAYLAEQIRLPCRPEHANEEILYVINTVRSFYKAPIVDGIIFNTIIIAPEKPASLKQKGE